MGKTHKRNDRWKTDRRDVNFQKSKKFKKSKNGVEFSHPKKSLTEPTEIVDFENNNDDI